MSDEREQAPAAPDSRLLSTLGLCARAGKTVVGTPMVCEAMRGKGTLYGVLEACDTSDNTHKKLSDKCSFYQVPLYRIPADCTALGRAVGKTGAVAAVGIADRELLRALSKYL